MRHRPNRGRGQALVEFALALPLFLLVVFVTIQFSLLFIWYYHEVHLTRQEARWLAVHPDTTDAAFASRVESSMRRVPGLVSGTPTLISTGGASSGQLSEWQVGQMRVRFSPCLPGGSSCTHPDRAPGVPVQVQMTYDPSHIMFLPTTFRIPAVGGPYVVGIPAALPTSTVWVMNE